MIFPAYPDTTAPLRSMPASLRSKLKRSDSDAQQAAGADSLSCECEDSEARCIRCDSPADGCTSDPDDRQLRCTRCLRDWNDDDDDCNCDDKDDRSLLVATILKRRLLYT